MLSIHVQLRKEVGPNFPAFPPLFCKTAVMLCSLAAATVRLLHNNVLQAVVFARLKTTLDNEASNTKYFE